MESGACAKTIPAVFVWELHRACEEHGGGFKAILWYPGEADASRRETAEKYLRRFGALMASFRGDLRQPDLPLYSAQLSRHASRWIGSVRVRFAVAHPMASVAD
jgi:hypothetical protein